LECYRKVILHETEQAGDVTTHLTFMSNFRAADRGFGPPPPGKSGRAENFRTKSERVTLRCRMPLAWLEGSVCTESDTVGGDKNMCNIIGTWAPFRTVEPW
jgi:hypothetical protein